MIMTTTTASPQLELASLKRSWIESAIPLVLEHTKDRLPFVVDSLHDVLPKPEDDHWYGILIARMKRQGLIERIGCQPSERPEANGRLISIWRVTH
jgi:hypothetical protein